VLQRLRMGSRSCNLMRASKSQKNCGGGGALKSSNSVSFCSSPATLGVAPLDPPGRRRHHPYSTVGNYTPSGRQKRVRLRSSGSQVTATGVVVVRPATIVSCRSRTSAPANEPLGLLHSNKKGAWGRKPKLQEAEGDWLEIGGPASRKYKELAWIGWKKGGPISRTIHRTGVDR
jgi:hypothetical protein